MNLPFIKDINNLVHRYLVNRQSDLDELMRSRATLFLNFGPEMKATKLLNPTRGYMTVDYDAFYIAAIYGYLTIIKWLTKQCRDLFIVEEVIAAAARKGHLKIVKFIILNLDYHFWDAINIAAGYGYLDIVKWLVRHGGAQSAVHAIDDAAINGHLTIVKWLHFNCDHENICTTQSIDYAAKNGHFDIVKWLYHHRSEGYTADAIQDAMKNGHFGIANWLKTGNKFSILNVWF